MSTGLLLLACGQGSKATTVRASDSATQPAAPEVPAQDAGVSTDTSSEVLLSSGAKGGGIDLFPDATLARAAAALAHGSTTARTFASYPGFHYVQARRVQNGSPEIHDHWVDVTIVQSGRATLLTGGTVAGGHLTSPGEHRGGTISGGTPQHVAAGDLVTIPAGVPHQYQLAPSDSVHYLTIKIRQP